MIESKDFTNLGFPADADADVADVADFAADGLDDSAEQVGDASGVQEQIDKLRADPAFLDLDHRNPAQHRKIIEQIDKLTQKKMAGQPSPTEKMFAEIQAEQVKKQEAQHAAAIADYDWLGENGFNSTSDPPDVVPEYLAQAWKQQRALAESDYAALGPMLESSLAVVERQGKLPAGKASAIRELLRAEGVDPSLKNRVDQIAAGIIALLHDANVPKKGTR